MCERYKIYHERNTQQEKRHITKEDDEGSQ